MAANTHILSVEDQGIEAVLNRLYFEANRHHALSAGISYFKHFLDNIFEAMENNGDIGCAIETAVESGVPEGLIKMALQYSEWGFEAVPGFDQIEKMLETDTGNDLVYQIFTPDKFFEAALTGGSYRKENGSVHDIRAAKIWAQLVHYIWQGMRINLITQKYFLNDHDTSDLVLSDYISQDGEIYFEMLFEKIKETKGQEIIVKGIFDALALLGCDLARDGDALNSAMALLGIIQAQAAFIDAENADFPDKRIKKIIDVAIGRQASPLQSHVFSETSLNSDLKNRFKNSFYQLDIKSKKQALSGLSVSICADDLYKGLGGIQTSQQVMISAALQSIIVGAVPHTIILEPDSGLNDVKTILTDAWGQGLCYLDVYRLRSSWDEPLLSTDISKYTKGKLDTKLTSEVM